MRAELLKLIFEQFFTFSSPLPHSICRAHDDLNHGLRLKSCLDNAFERPQPFPPPKKKKHIFFFFFGGGEGTLNFLEKTIHPPRGPCPGVGHLLQNLSLLGSHTPTKKNIKMENYVVNTVFFFFFFFLGGGCPAPSFSGRRKQI